MDHCRKQYELQGWRKHKLWRSSLKSSLRSTGKACASTSKNKETTIKTQVSEYLRLADQLGEKIAQSSRKLYNSPAFDVKLFALLESLSYYQEMIAKHIDLIERRLLKGQTIPSEEKVFSIFEPHTVPIAIGRISKRKSEQKD
jgi:hypothetical protein